MSIYYDIKNTLIFYKGLGINGIDLSQKSTEILKDWGDFKRPSSKFQVLNKKDIFETLLDIQKDISGCKRCSLHNHRKKIVFGYGNPEADLLFLGHSPDKEEDITGMPFTGACGDLLNKIISAMKLTRESVYMCNLLKCKVSKNSGPDLNDISICFNFLERQINIIKPKYICALGKCAAKSLIKLDIPFSEMRGQFFKYRGIKVIATYHPEQLIEKPQLKRDVWEDIKKLMKDMGL